MPGIVADAPRGSLEQNGHAPSAFDDPGRAKAGGARRRCPWCQTV